MTHSRYSVRSSLAASSSCTLNLVASEDYVLELLLNVYSKLRKSVLMIETLDLTQITSNFIALAGAFFFKYY